MSKLASRVSAATGPEELPYMMRVDEVAVWLGITSGAVRKAIVRGDIPVVRKGSIMRIPRDGIVSPRTQ